MCFLCISSRLKTSTRELKEEQPRRDEGVGHLQLEQGASRVGALELELAEAREAKRRLEGEVRQLQEKLERKSVLSLCILLYILYYIIVMQCWPHSLSLSVCV